MHQFRQECADFNEPVGISPIIKVTPCFLHFRYVKKYYIFFLQIYAYFNIFVQSKYYKKIRFITSKFL